MTKQKSVPLSFDLCFDHSHRIVYIENSVTVESQSFEKARKSRFWLLLHTDLQGMCLWHSLDELYGLYLLYHCNGQMYMYLIASSIKNINKRVLQCTNSGQPGWFHVETHMYILGLWFANIAAAKIMIKCIQQ